MKIKINEELKFFLIFLLISSVIFIIMMLIKKQYLNKRSDLQLAKHRNKCVLEDGNLQPCVSPFAVSSADKSSQLIERNTLKSVLNEEAKYKLMDLTNVFVPSVMYGSYCNQIYTTYYDFLKANYKPHIYAFLKEKKVKRVRIRHYYFDPNSYLEIKYKENKIRVLIDCQYNIIESVDPLYEEIVSDIISKIKNGEIPELFLNEYKRFSFVYKGNQSIRMTIDTNIKIKYLDITAELPFDILEIKYDKNIPKNKIVNYFEEIGNDINDKIELSNFSKVDYSNENIIIPYNIKTILSKVQW